MNVKLYIFESVEDAKAFSAQAPTPARQRAETRDTEEAEPIVRRKYKKKASLEKEAFKERIIKKAKAAGSGLGRGHGVRHCKKCGEAGHRSDGCPRGTKDVGIEAAVEHVDRIFDDTDL